VIAHTHSLVRVSVVRQRARKSLFQNILPLTYLFGILCQYKQSLSPINVNGLKVLARRHNKIFSRVNPWPIPIPFWRRCVE